MEKMRPNWQKNHLNGIGGKIEKEESPHQAMERECMEETGVVLEWHCKGVMRGINGDGKEFECHIFYAYSDTIYEYKQIEDEPLGIYLTSDLKEKKLIRNLSYLIPFGENSEDGEFIRLEYK